MFSLFVQQSILWIGIKNWNVNINNILVFHVHLGNFSFPMKRKNMQLGIADMHIPLCGTNSFIICHVCWRSSYSILRQSRMLCYTFALNPIIVPVHHPTTNQPHITTPHMDLCDNFHCWYVDGVSKFLSFTDKDFDYLQVSKSLFQTSGIGYQIMFHFIFACAFWSSICF